jgi:protein-S-isoprenylcysteine O-methyltransferase Ste14
MSDPAQPQHKPPPGRRGEYLVFIQFVLLFGFMFAPVWNLWATQETLGALAPLRWPLGLGCAGLGLILGALGVLQIRAYLTPLPYPVDHNQLVRHGVYGVVRHPLYSSQLFVALGWVLFSLSLSHLAILAVGFVFFDFKAGKEERWLTERHPDYVDYARSVRKLIPRIY